MSKPSSRNESVYFISIIALWFVASLTYFHQYIIRNSMASFSTAWKSLEGMSYTHVAWLASGYYFAYIIFQPLAGLLITYMDVRKLLYFSSLFVAACCFFMTAFDSFQGFLFIQILSGIGGAFSLIGTLTLARKLFSKDVFPMINSLTFVIGGMGAFFAGAPLYLLISTFNWRYAMIFLGIASLLISVLIRLIKPSINTSCNTVPLGGESVGEQCQKDKTKSAIIDVFRLKRFWIICFFAGLLFLPIPVLSAFWLELYEKALFNKPASMLQLSSTMLFLGYIFGNLSSGYLLSKVKNQRLLLQMASIFAFVSVSILLYTNLKNYFYVFNFFLMSVGFFCSFALVSIPILQTFIPERSLPIAFSCATFLIALFGAVEIPIVGVIIDHQPVIHSVLTIEDFRHAFIFIPLSPLIATFFSFFIFKK